MKEGKLEAAYTTPEHGIRERRKELAKMPGRERGHSAPAAVGTRYAGNAGIR